MSALDYRRVWPSIIGSCVHCRRLVEVLALEQRVLVWDPVPGDLEEFRRLVGPSVAAAQGFGENAGPGHGCDRPAAPLKAAGGAP